MPWSNPGPAQQVIIAGPGGLLFVYSPTPGLGNLIFSCAASAGTDPYGNTYPAGLGLKEVTTTSNPGSIFWNINGDQGGSISSTSPTPGTPTDGDSLTILAPFKNVAGFPGDISLARGGPIDIHPGAGTFLTLSGKTQAGQQQSGDGITFQIGNVGTPSTVLARGSGSLVFSGANTSAALAISFGVTLPNANYQILLGVAAITGNTVVSASWFNKATTGFSLTGRIDNGNVLTGNVAVDWMVIG